MPFERASMTKSFNDRRRCSAVSTSGGGSSSNLGAHFSSPPFRPVSIAAWAQASNEPQTENTKKAIRAKREADLKDTVRAMKEANKLKRKLKKKQEQEEQRPEGDS